MMSFFKSAWNAAWQDPAYFAIAQIDCLRKNWTHALEHVERSLIRNWHNHKARQLKASLLRKAGKKEEALKWINESLETDRFNIGCRFEKYLLTENTTDLEEIHTLTRGSAHDFIEYALDFAAAGLYEEAELLLKEYISFFRQSGQNEEEVYPMVYYVLGYFASQSGEVSRAKAYYEKAAGRKPDKCFPNRIEEVNILQDAMKINPADAKAPYYLGDFWYGARQYQEAMDCWEKSIAIDATFPTVLRNLSLACYNKENAKEKARMLLEQAFALDQKDARILMELDQLYKKMGCAHSDRLAFLEKYLPLVEERDDLCIERITLYNQLGRYEEAKGMIANRKFHPWEGGEGKVTGQYVLCRLELAKIAIGNRCFEEALQLLNETEVYPHNLGEGKLENVEENDILYYKGIAYRGLGEEEKAAICFVLATQGSSEPRQAFYYNDQQPDKIYYQGLAWRALGEENKARSCFNKLISNGEKHLFDTCKIDYFAVSLPDLAIWDDDLNVRNKIHCYYVMGLGHLGLGNREKAIDFLSQLKELDINHQGGQVHLSEALKQD